MAQRLHFHERTARRRVDEAIDLLAQAAAEGGERPAPPPSEPWRVRSLDALLRLDTDGPELIERRTIVFTADGVGEIVGRFSVPRLADSHGRAHELRVEVLYAAGYASNTRPPTTQPSSTSPAPTRASAYRAPILARVRCACEWREYDAEVPDLVRHLGER